MALNVPRIQLHGVLLGDFLPVQKSKKFTSKRGEIHRGKKPPILVFD